MEPGHEDREYRRVQRKLPLDTAASMEPGHEDREYLKGRPAVLSMSFGPQWSPAMKTGNTGYVTDGKANSGSPQWSPAMKTGNTAGDRGCDAGAGPASMEPGHEDREYQASCSRSSRH